LLDKITYMLNEVKRQQKVSGPPSKLSNKPEITYILNEVKRQWKFESQP
jgi:hypothetical protein